MFRFITAGESHGRCLTAIIEGMPAGLAIDIDEINCDMARRQQGYGRGGRMKIEQDKVEITAGVRFGETLGSPITLTIHNKDWANWEERMAVDGNPQGAKVTAARPGHADLTGVQKYDREDIRDILERASARETAARVAVGAVAKQLLKSLQITVCSHVVNIGGVQGHCPAVYDDGASVCQSPADLHCLDAVAAEKMKAVIDEARQQGDTLGGIFEVAILNAMPGLGSHVQWDRRLDTRLAAAMMSIQAIKGVEIGAGFAFAGLSGAHAHDEICCDETGVYYRKTNHAGGVEGGMSNGQPIVVRAVMKPIPTLMKPLPSIDIASRRQVPANTERSDVCAVPAAAVVGEAMMAIVVAEAVLEQFGGSNMRDIIAAVDHYGKRISG